MESSPLPCPSYAQISFSVPYSSILLPSLDLRDQVSHSCITTGKIIVLHIVLLIFLCIKLEDRFWTEWQKAFYSSCVCSTANTCARFRGRVRIVAKKRLWLHDICLSACNSLAPSGRIFMIFYIGGLYGKCLEKIQMCLKSCKNVGHFT